MIKIKGNKNVAKCYASLMEETAIEQIQKLCNSVVSQNSIIRIMPDVHAGSGCTIGTTMTITDKIAPCLVGCDIGCGVVTVNLGQINLDLEKVDKWFHQNIPAGFSLRNNPVDFPILTLLSFYDNLPNKQRILQSLGTLGRGNHFIEIGKNTKKELFLTVHTGSRNLGIQVEKYYTHLAKQETKEYKNYIIQQKIEQLKKQGKMQQIEKEVEKVKADLQLSCDIPFIWKDKTVKNYIKDVLVCQEYSRKNKMIIINSFLEAFKIRAKEVIMSEHNYVDIENKILRKGAISAQKGQKLVIPLNMKEGVIIGYGKDIKDWNFSAPHGAGRRMSRKEAKNNIKLEDFKREMEGIFSTCIVENTLDESPFAYKNLSDVLPIVHDTVNIVEIVKPIYNFKAVD